MSKRRMWIQEEIETLRKLVSEGKSAEEISEEMKRTKASIQNKMRELKIKSNWERTGKNTVWTVDNVEKLKRLNDKGETPQKIADELNCTKSSIHSKMSELKIKSKCKKVAKKRTTHFYKVGEVVNDSVKIVELTRVKQKTTTIKAYIVESIEYPDAPYNTMDEYSLKRGDGCAYKRGLKVYPGNSLYSIEHIRPNIIDIEQAKSVTPYYTKNKIKFKCSNIECDNIKMMTPSQLVSSGFACSLCSKNLSYGQIAYGQYNEYFKLGFESEKILPELPNRRVDFINWNNGMWVEIQGIQHFNKNARGYKQACEQDAEKRAFAKNSDKYNLIEIDMRISSWEYFKEQINNCGYLPSINDEDEKAILKLMEKNSKYPISTIKHMYEVKGYSVQYIADELGYKHHQIQSVLKRNNIKTMNRTKKIRCVTTGEVFDSVKIASEELGLNINSVKSVVNPNSSYQSTKGYKFEYLK